MPNLQLKLDSFDNEWQPPYWDGDLMQDSPLGLYKFLNTEEWYITGRLKEFLEENSLAEIIPYPGIVPQFNSALSTSENVNRNNSQWKEFLRTYKNSIQPGDLVFYNWDGGDWDHVAVVTDWSVQTYFNATGNDPWGRIAEQLYYLDIAPYDCGFDWDMVKPRVVEQSGAIQYRNNRSVDNTNSSVASIMFAHIR